MAEDWRDDVDDEWFEDWDDDRPPPKLEPDCYACNDHGCRSCDPPRWQVWWWQNVSRRVSNVKLRRAARRGVNPDEPPF
ncbi:hypothetical protein CU254_14785 [Amycolatopsis sp. AA4]|uniref:hypothetical protein n=1 Tax=Actinomycetes TaxID=1760 RepID=UPI0001B55017|nr:MULTISPECIES: hypothetical protein [Actinomycetes]ATY11584.1 hypothetical protein CU254_14785 [Amycolatopsis sp. AA4]EFL07227.1 predicted protein [Streptomyces sp. AA4]